MLVAIRPGSQGCKPIVVPGGPLGGWGRGRQEAAVTRITKQFDRKFLKGLACGLVPAYPSVCSFEFPIGEYVGDGQVETIPGFESVSVPANIDRFATATNALLPKFNTLFYEEHTAGVDAFA